MSEGGRPTSPWSGQATANCLLHHRKLSACHSGAALAESLCAVSWLPEAERNGLVALGVAQLVAPHQGVGALLAAGDAVAREHRPAGEASVLADLVASAPRSGRVGHGCDSGDSTEQFSGTR